MDAVSLGPYPPGNNNFTKVANSSSTVVVHLGLLSMETYARIRVVTRTFRLLFSLLGIVTNVINIRTFVLMGLVESVTIGLFSLACTDLFICTCTLLGFACGLIEIFEDAYNLTLYLPSIILIVYIECCRRVFVLSSVLTTVFLAVQRCLCVVVPFHVKGVFTKFRTCCYVMGIVTFSVTYYGVFMSSYRITEIHSPLLNTSQLAISVKPGSEGYYVMENIFLAIGLNTTCMTIILLCLIVMYVKLSESRRFRQSLATVTNKRPGDNVANVSSTNVLNSKETQALIQVTLISALFVLTNIPYLGFGITTRVLDEFAIHRAFHNTYRIGLSMKIISDAFNASMNLVIYYNFSTRFRQHCSLSRIKTRHV